MILDVDGTLVDSNDAHARAWVQAFAEQGITVAYARVRRSIGMGGDKLMPAVAGIEETSSRGKQISARRGEIFRRDFLPALRPFPKVRDLLDRLRADGYTITVASSAEEDELTPLLEVAGAADLISDQTSSDDAESSKPDPDIVHAALRRINADPPSTIMIGDTPYDIEAALRAGIRIVGVESGGWTRHELKGASEIYADVAELLHRYDSSIFKRDGGGLHGAPDPRAVFERTS